MERACFVQVVMDFFNNSQSKCPNQCNLIKYKLNLAESQSSLLLSSRLDKVGLDGYFRNESLQVIVTNVEDHEANLYDGDYDYAKTRLKQMSILHLTLDNDDAFVYTQDAKMTPFFLLGNIGGFVGIFLGYSFMTMVDGILGFIHKLTQKMTFRTKKGERIEKKRRIEF